MMFQVGKSEAAAVNQLTVMFDTNLSSGGVGMVLTEKDRINAFCLLHKKPSF